MRYENNTTRTDFYDDDKDEEDEGNYCSSCNGSGEGRFEYTTCYSCNGSGMTNNRKEDYDE